MLNSYLNLIKDSQYEDYLELRYECAKVFIYMSRYTDILPEAGLVNNFYETYSSCFEKRSLFKEVKYFSFTDLQTIELEVALASLNTPIKSVPEVNKGVETWVLSTVLSALANDKKPYAVPLINEYFPKIMSQPFWSNNRRIIENIINECYSSCSKRATVGFKALFGIVSKYIKQEDDEIEKVSFFNGIEVFCVCFYWLHKSDIGMRLQAMSLIKILIMDHEEQFNSVNPSFRSRNFEIDPMQQYSKDYFMKNFSEYFQEFSYAIIGELFGKRVTMNGVNQAIILEIASYQHD